MSLPTYLTGAQAKFYFGTIGEGQTKPPDVEIISIEPSLKAAEQKATTSSTTGGGSETSVQRVEGTIKVTSVLRNAAGAKINGSTLALTVGGTAKPVTKVSYTKNFTKEKTTSASTPAGFSHFTPVRSESKGKMDIWVEDAADIAVSNTVLATVITLDTGHTISGNAKFSGKDYKIDVEKVTLNSYDFAFQGAPTETGLGLASGVVADCLIEMNTGKTIGGKAAIFGVNIEADVDNDLKITYDIAFIDTISEAA